METRTNMWARASDLRMSSRRRVSDLPSKNTARLRAGSARCVGGLRTQSRVDGTEARNRGERAVQIPRNRSLGLKQILPVPEMSGGH
jgi:hypothetical protein